MVYKKMRQNKKKFYGKKKYRKRYNKYMRKGIQSITTIS